MACEYASLLCISMYYDDFDVEDQSLLNSNSLGVSHKLDGEKLIYSDGFE